MNKKDRVKKLIYIVLSIIILMLIIPLITVKIVKADSGMLVSLLFFFAINPIFSLILGIISAKDIKFFWFVPLLLGVMFWICSSVTYKTAFPIVYSAVYFLISSVAMLVTYIVLKKK